MKKFNNIPKKSKLDLDVNLKEDTLDSTGELINSKNINKEQLSNIEELKQLEKVLDSLVNSGKEHIAEKYLEGFLEARSLTSLKDYLKSLK